MSPLTSAVMDLLGAQGGPLHPCAPVMDAGPHCGCCTCPSSGSAGLRLSGAPPYSPPPWFLAVLTFREIWNRSFCRPLEQLVDVITEFPNEVEYIFRPSCVSLQRCGGCCGDEGLHCVPVETSTVTMQVSTAAAGPWLHRGGGGLLAKCREGELVASHPPDIVAAWITGEGAYSQLLKCMPNQEGPSACSLGLSLRPRDTPGGTGLAPCFPCPLLSVWSILLTAVTFPDLPCPVVGLGVSQLPMTLPAEAKQVLLLNHREK